MHPSQQSFQLSDRPLNLPRFTFLLGSDKERMQKLAFALTVNGGGVVYFAEPIFEAVSVMCSQNWSLVSDLHDYSKRNTQLPFLHMTYQDMIDAMRDALNPFGLERMLAQFFVDRNMDETDPIIIPDTISFRSVELICLQVPSRECLVISTVSPQPGTDPHGLPPLIVLAGDDHADNVLQISRELGYQS